MNKFIYGIVTLSLGFFFHLLFQHFLSFYGIGPHFLLLCVVAIGFIRGPLMAESFGFIWGLLADSMGIHLFGLNSFLLTFAGYSAGQLRRRVAIERPVAQLVVGLLSTVYYVIGTVCFQLMFEENENQGIFMHIVVSGILNMLLVMAVFWFIERWVWWWRLEAEQI